MREDRTGTGTVSIFGTQTRYDLQAGFPAVTTKRLFFRGVKEELCWFLRGEHNVRSLQEKNVHIWDEWALENGELGPVYGVQWRAWPSERGPIDQLQQVVNEIRENPFSRRLLVSAWNVSCLSEMRLPPCHVLFQFYVQAGRLSCQVYQRSGDLFLGVPFNIASYALLTHLVAKVTHLEVGELIHTLGDAHLYQNHLQQAKLQLSREPYPLPKLVLPAHLESLDDVKSDEISLENYRCHPSISAPVAV